MTDIDTYPIQARIECESEPVPLNIEKLRATLQLLNVGGGFVIPATELRDHEGRFLTTPIGQRVHGLAKKIGIRITTKKLAEGLRVRREK